MTDVWNYSSWHENHLNSFERNFSFINLIWYIIRLTACLLLYNLWRQQVLYIDQQNMLYVTTLYNTLSLIWCHYQQDEIICLFSKTVTNHCWKKKSFMMVWLGLGTNTTWTLVILGDLYRHGYCNNYLVKVRGCSWSWLRETTIDCH